MVDAPKVRVVGRYALYQAIAAGGMATVHLGRLLGPVGFSRTVAIKRLHAQFASDPEFVSMFLDEARLAARIRHPNVVPTLDVVSTGGELFLVMEYVAGESIARLARVLRENKQPLPLPILSSVMAGVLHGLHAAHEAKDERGNPLEIVHRDVSPQNVLVGTDGVARVLDFGVAKATGRVQTTREGQIKGKLSYMPPEQLRGASVTRQSDIYAAGVMLWELVTGERLFSGDNEGTIVRKVLEGNVEAPSVVLMRSMTTTATLNDNVFRGIENLDSTVLRALAMNPDSRFRTAREMAIEIERKLQPATGSQVADWVDHVAKDILRSRAAMVAEIESSTSHTAAEPREGHVQSVLSAKSMLRLEDPVVTDRASDPGRAVLTLAGSPDVPSLGPAQSQSGASARYSGPFTQPSSNSVRTDTHGPSSDPPGGNKLILAALVGMMLAAAVLVSAVAWRHSRLTKAKPAHATASTSTTGAAAANADPTPRPTLANAGAAEEAGAIAPSSDAASMQVATAQVATAPIPTAAQVATAQLATAAPIPTAAPGGASKGGAKPGRGRATSAGSTEDCKTPYWFDAQEVKHYKPQCLEK